MSTASPSPSAAPGDRQMAGKVEINLLDLANRIRAAHTEVISATRHIVTHAIAAGDLLIGAKKALDHGQWLPWLKDNCDLSERTANRYMNVAKGKAKLEQLARDKSASVSDLTLVEAYRLFADNEAAHNDAKRKDNGSVGSAKASDTYDKVEEKLIKKLEALPLEQAEAAIEETIRKLKKTVATLKLGFEQAQKKAS